IYPLKLTRTPLNLDFLRTATATYYHHHTTPIIKTALIRFLQFCIPLPTTDDCCTSIAFRTTTNVKLLSLSSCPKHRANSKYARKSCALRQTLDSRAIRASRDTRERLVASS
ncbi:unnamed protein product, partial [Acanthoscelides obtectus]